MRDESIGSITPSSRCSLCGTTLELDALRFECVTKTTWNTKDDKSFDEYCDPRVWPVALCRACRVENYRVSLKKMARYSLSGMLACIVFIILGGFNVWADFFQQMHPGKGDLWMILFGLAGVIGFPVSIWFYVVNKVHLGRSENLQEIPTRRRRQTFMAAGETILERLETGRADLVYGDFPLPVFPENPVPRDIPEKFKQKELNTTQKRMVRWIERVE